jgi:hypothetical protein
MTDLRRHLESARQEHVQARYPGELAAELLPAPRRAVLKLFATGAAISGIAAAILLVIWWSQPTPATSPTPIAVATTQLDKDDAILLFFPDSIPLVPSSPDVEIGSMPTMPSMDLSFTDIDLSKEST